LPADADHAWAMPFFADAGGVGGVDVIDHHLNHHLLGDWLV